MVEKSEGAVWGEEYVIANYMQYKNTTVLFVLIVVSIKLTFKMDSQ